MSKIYYPVIILLFILNSCYVPPETRKSTGIDDENTVVNIKTSKSVSIPNDKSMTPVPGEQYFANPDTVLYIKSIGEKFEVKNGQEVNFIFEDNIDPDEIYFSYESTYDGYILQSHTKSERIKIEFKRMCQKFIVGNPNLTQVEIPESLRYEQIIWTPRSDGTWEVRIGTTERGCRSKALRELQKLRNNGYEKQIPR